MLKSNPELVHLDEVGEDETDGVLEVSGGSTTARRRGKVVREEVSSSSFVPPSFELEGRQEDANSLDSPLILSDRQAIPRLTREVMPQEQSSRRMLNTSSHLHHVLHDLLDGSVGDGHVD